MIGPSAPNGPPVPIAIAEEMGLRISTRAADSAFAEQHPLHHFGNAVPANRCGPIARHDPNDDRTDDRDRDERERIVRAASRRDELQGKSLIERDVRHQADQSEQQLRSERSEDGHRDRTTADPDRSPVDRDVLCRRPKALRNIRVRLRVLEPGSDCQRAGVDWFCIA